MTHKFIWECDLCGRETIIIIPPHSREGGEAQIRFLRIGVGECSYAEYEICAVCADETTAMLAAKERKDKK